jgi:hypothetical protein
MVLFAAIILSAVLPVAALAQSEQAVNTSIDNVLGDHALYQKTIEALQQGVKDHDAKAVAALVSYPITVKVKGTEKTIETADEFVANYDAIVTPEIADAVTKQKYADLFVNYQGVMLGNGEVWVNGVCKDKACTTVEAKVVTIQQVGSR